MDFIPQHFIDNLGYMGKGMLAIFVVIGVIIIATTIVNKICSSSHHKPPVIKLMKRVAIL